MTPAEAWLPFFFRPLGRTVVNPGEARFTLPLACPPVRSEVVGKNDTSTPPKRWRVSVSHCGPLRLTLPW